VIQIKSEYPVKFAPSFILFWILFGALALYFKGLLLFATVALMLIVILHHEYAHVKQCEKRGVIINEVRFNWLGGLVETDIRYANDAVPIYTAGVINTGCYAVAFTGLLAVITYIGRTYAVGINFANNPYLEFLTSIILFTTVMFFTNMLPISYKSKKYGVMMTDGLAAFHYRVLRDELTNEGKYDAINWKKQLGRLEKNDKH
jgi:hypothetical protein